MHWVRDPYRWSWLLCSLMIGCGQGKQSPAAAPAKNIPAPADTRRIVLFVGTSLTAGLGLSPAEAFPAQIQAKIDSAALDFRVINAGVSGETSAGALRRMDWLLSQQPVAVVVLETGANDGLRGQSVDSLRANLEAILDRAERQVPPPIVMLAGMEAPPNLGRSYATRFRAVFPDVARRRHAHFLPFLLNGVAGIDSLNQTDGIHPTPLGARIAARNVWTVLAPLLDSLTAARR
ncbi:MAG: arylesterase [Gemmatimonadota bacterium]